MENQPIELPFKIKFFLFLINKYSNKSIFNLLFNYKEIDTILKKIDIKQLTKFLYANNCNIHKCLYEDEEVIYIKSEKINNISFYLYLCLILENYKTIVDYNYSLQFIKDINNQTCDGVLKKIIISKIILELINNYSNYNYNKSEDEELNSISQNSVEIINKNIKNIDSIKDLDLNWTCDKIKSMNLDEIYIDILTSLIKSKNFGDNNFTFDILNQIEMENFDLTEIMINNLFNLFDDKDFLAKYKISQLDDLFNIDKLNFLFILFKYILKEELFIYQNNFLFKIRNFFLREIKLDNKFSEKYEKSNDDIKNKIEFILNFFTKSDYYLNRLKDKKGLKNSKFVPIETKVNIKKILEMNNNSVNDIQSNANKKVSDPFLRPSVDEAHKNPNREIENIIIENKISNKTIENILYKSSFKLHTSFKDGKKVIEYDEIKAGETLYRKIIDIKEMTLDSIELGTKNFNSYINFIYFLNEVENTIINRYKKKDKLEIELLFSKPNCSINPKNENYIDINCKYIHLSLEYKDENILNIKVHDGLNLFIDEINNGGYEEN